MLLESIILTVLLYDDVVTQINDVILFSLYIIMLKKGKMKRKKSEKSVSSCIYIYIYIHDTHVVYFKGLISSKV